MRIHGDIYELAGINHDEKCVAQNIEAEIVRSEWMYDPETSTRVPSGGEVAISPPQSGLSVNPGSTYEIRCAVDDTKVQFTPSRIGVAITHNSEVTLIKTA